MQRLECVGIRKYRPIHIGCLRAVVMKNCLASKFLGWLLVKRKICHALSSEMTESLSF
jgi:hypothetical protein